MGTRQAQQGNPPADTTTTAEDDIDALLASASDDEVEFDAYLWAVYKTPCQKFWGCGWWCCCCDQESDDKEWMDELLEDK